MFKKIFTELCEKHNESPTNVCLKIGLSNAAYSQWTDQSTPRQTTLSRIAKYFNVSIEYLLGKEETSLPWINVLGRVAAGIPFEAIEDIVDQEQLSPGTDLSFEYFGLQIQGDSMEPKFSNGDTVIVRVQPDCENDDIVIAMIDNEKTVCKKIKKTPEGIFLISTNTAYDPLFFTNAEIEQRPVTILGKVIELRAKF